MGYDDWKAREPDIGEAPEPLSREEEIEMASIVDKAQAKLDGEDIGMPTSDLIEDMMHEIIRLDRDAAAERERCARIVELHENFVRDYSRDVFARRIAALIRSGQEPDVRELEFARVTAPSADR